MSKLIASLIIVTISLFGSEKFTDSDMKNSVLNILNNKQKVYTVPEIVNYLFSIKARGEFETKSNYKTRIDKLLGKDGLFFVYDIVSEPKYNIDTKIMKFYTPIQGGNARSSQQPNDILKKKGYTKVIFELDFNNTFPITTKLKNYKYPYAFIDMSVKDAKKLKNSKNTFYQIVAIKITPDNLMKRKTKDDFWKMNGIMQYDLEAEVPCKMIGSSLISLNPQKVIFSFGINK